MNKNKVIRKEVEFNGKKLSFETGEVAFMANRAIKATYGDTVILVTVVAGEANPDLDFFPLTVNYEEKLYASGLIKSSRFVKRDGRPSDDAIIAKRLCGRCTSRCNRSFIGRYSRSGIFSLNRCFCSTIFI